MRLYFHVPFCLKKCAYCNFYSVPFRAELGDLYLSALKKELQLKGILWGTQVSSLYFGGGTPSTLAIEDIAGALIECRYFFSWDKDAEITVEVNPCSSSEDYLVGLRKLGVNRISIGMQTDDNYLLERIGRSHTHADTLATLQGAVLAGFINISVDLIFGLPGQTLERYLETIDAVCQLPITHISTYALQIEKDTPFFRQLENNELHLPIEDDVADMMIQGKTLLVARGFRHYEISNFAKAVPCGEQYDGNTLRLITDYRSQHNVAYWMGEEYLGFGPAATSFVKGRRFQNVASIDSYVSILNSNQLPTGECEHLDKKMAQAEAMIIGLRLLDEGVNRANFYKRFGIDPVLCFADTLSSLESGGMVVVDSEKIILAEKVIFIANQVQMAFLP
ncbi:MAG: radical SAM family heme chaperone HemW [bacterium]|nr:radical SAM family heme chaperone HemW [bacterium]